VLRAGGAERVRQLDDLTQLGAAVAAAAGSTWAAWRTGGRVRRAWSAVGGGAAMWAAGQVVWCYYELVTGSGTPFPSVADAGYLLFPIGAAIGLWLLPSTDGTQGRARWLLDGGIVVSSLITISWATTLGAVARSGGDTPFAFAVSLAYPIGDILILSLAIMALCRPQADRRQLVLLSVAMTAMAVADSSFAYLNAVGRYSTGSLTDIGWVAAFLLLALAGVDAGARRVAAPTTLTGRAATATMLPYLPLLAAAATLGVRHAQGHRLDGPELAGISVGLVLVLTRQYLTVRENRALLLVVAAREAQLHDQAFHDPLTGLANRALFINRADHALELHGRDLRPVSVLFVDLDDFKTINDTMGHAAGDEVLIRVADRLRGALRNGDTLARLGGDEFAVLLEDGGEPANVGDRLVESLQAPFRLEGGLVTIRASVGLTQLLPEENTPTLDVLLAHADIAMYSAKRAGKGRLACYEPTMTSLHADDVALRAPLVGAIESGAIDIAYQPIADITTGEIVCVEALARWEHDGRAVPPVEFIPMAARAGALGDLTVHMLDRSTAQVARWTRQFGRPLQVSVNVPPSAIVDRAFPDVVADVLARNELDPTQLVLEITEEALLDDLATATDVTQRLRALGVQLSLDDFGTGYSSLLHLQNIELDSLKIDRGFISNLDTEPAAERLVDGILFLATRLGLEVIAEGVERKSQADVLQRLGCTLVQGYLYTPPGTVRDITRTLLSRTGHPSLGSSVSPARAVERRDHAHRPHRTARLGAPAGLRPHGDS
jgi:diguanylate cyclase (GGDEF)-like protein